MSYAIDIDWIYFLKKSTLEDCASSSVPNGL